mmetsp:Transcript_28415/g.85131  ORF Transcript_28415/g.85131 Transcript_28415/m.85131 type:complete len:271 (-) Transcript_28415:1457-2269(-)
MKQSLVLRLRCPRSQSTFTPESSAAAGAAFLARLARRIFSERINALRLLPTPPNPVDAFRECAIPEGWAVVQTLLEASVACGVVMSCPRAMLRTRAGLGRVDAALKHATRRCPFLGANPGVLPPIEPKAAAPSVHPDALKLVASKCPVMAPVVHSPAFKLGTITQAVVQTAHNEVMTSFAVKGHQTCPGLNTPPVCPVTNTLQSPTSGKCPYAHSSDGTTPPPPCRTYRARCCGRYIRAGMTCAGRASHVLVFGLSPCRRTVGGYAAPQV